jgi:hypothetical protein
MKCIICAEDKSEESFTKEHVFPESIGGTLTVDACRSCNPYLGHNIDSHLANHPFVQLARLHLKLPGKKGEIPNPLERGTVSNDPGQKVQFRFVKGEPKGLYFIPRIKREMKDQNIETVEVRVAEEDRDTIPDIINKMITRSGLTPLLKEEIESKIVADRIPLPEICVPMKVDVIWYHRALLKIAYELAHHWLGPSYFTDPVGEALRAHLNDRTLNVGSPKTIAVRAQIGFGPGFALPLWNNEPNAHIAIMKVAGSGIIGLIRVFQVFNAAITVSETASLYPLFVDKFLLIDPSTGTTRQTDLDTELLRVAL